MRNHIADGRVLAVLATAAILGGSLVKVGDLVGVAATDIAAGESGSVAITSVYEVPKKAGIVAPQGAKLYLEAASGAITTTEAGNTFAGHAYAAAAGADTVVQLRLVG